MQARPAQSGRGGQQDHRQRGGRRCPWTRLPEKIPKVGSLYVFFLSLSLYTTAHCFGNIINRVSGILPRGTKIADVADTIIIRQF